MSKNRSKFWVRAVCLTTRLWKAKGQQLKENPGLVALPGKTPEGAPPASTRGLEASNHLVWSHPITLRSLVVWSTDVGPKIFRNFDKFLAFVKVVWDHLGCVWGVVRGPQEQLWSNIFLSFFCFF